MDVRRPVGSAAVAATFVIGLLSIPGADVEPAGFVAGPAAAASLVAFSTWNGARIVGSFLRGMGDASAGLVVESDTAGWFGGRTVIGHTAQGRWRIETWNGGTVSLWVTPPRHTRPLLHNRRYREAGRQAAARVAGRGP